MLDEVALAETRDQRHGSQVAKDHVARLRRSIARKQCFRNERESQERLRIRQWRGEHCGQDGNGKELLTCQLVSNGSPVIVMRWMVRRGRGAMRGW